MRVDTLNPKETETSIKYMETIIHSFQFITTGHLWRLEPNFLDRYLEIVFNTIYIHELA